MPTTRNTTPRRCHAASLLALAMVGTTAGADVFSLYIDDDAHFYTTTGMPDFDQWRRGLLANGKCHCGPANAANLLAFIALHDAPQVAPFLPEAAWNDPGTYEAVTEFIHDFGVAAGTEASADTCSTSHGPMVEGISSAGDGWVGRHFDVSHHAWDRFDPDSIPPRFREFTGRLAAEQAVGIAFRSTWGGQEGPQDRWITAGNEDRAGGHYMALHSALRSGTVDRVWLRNSSDEKSEIATQSTFNNVVYDVKKTYFFQGPDLKILDRLGDTHLNDSGDLRQNFFYGYLIVSPKWFFGWGEGEHILERIPCGPFLGSGFPGTAMAEFDSPIDCVAHDSSGRSAAVLAGGRLHRVRPNELNDLVIEPIDLELPDATTIDFDRSFGLHAIAGTSAMLIDWHTGLIRATAPLPAAGTDVVVVDQRPHVLVPQLQAIVAVVHEEAGGNPQTSLLPLPPDVAADQGSTLEMLPGGRLFLLTNGILHPMRIGPDGLESIQVPVPRQGHWQGISRAGRNLLCLTDADGRVEVHRLEDQGFVRVHDHAFNDIDVPANFLPSRSHRTGGEDRPDPHHEGDTDDSGTVIEDCPADLNFDGMVDSADMGLMLGDWGDTHSLADLNHDGTVDAADLGMLLGSWDRCP